MEQPSGPDATPTASTADHRPSAAGTSAAAANPAADADPGLVRALDRLVQRAVLSRPQADAVLTEVTAAADAATSGRRRVLAEIAGYLGAAFVIGATVLYLSEQWDPLGRGGRFAVLAAMTLVLAGGGLLIRLRDRATGIAWWAGRPADDVRRRLAGTLFTGAGIAAGFAAFVLLQPSPDSYDSAAAERAVLVAAAVALVVMLTGYLAARGAVGQLGGAAAALTTVISALTVTGSDDSAVYGVAIVLLGVAWVAGYRLGLFAERRLALGIAVTLALIGAQIAVAGGAAAWIGYLLTAGVAALCFAAYARVRDWVLLAGGVVGATLVVPEFLYDVTEGSLGAAGVMLVAGVTLLAASLAGLRIRRAPADLPAG